MEITNDIRTKVFAQYIGQKVYHSVKMVTGEREDMGLMDLDYELLNIYSEDSDYKGQLLLKSLKNITDEDMIWVYDTCKNLHEQRKINPEFVKENSMSLEDMKLQINNGHAHYTGGWLCNTWVFQYLLSKGYDLPQYLLGYKTLHEVGLAAYE
ncbi:MAG TPA: hypothetical protein VN026_11535 [Bacteroidia bacterium]|jgi:hypothetical protein|nr:hypothetical protein [Bacteroidia bacterium]